MNAKFQKPSINFGEKPCFTVIFNVTKQNKLKISLLTQVTQSVSLAIFGMCKGPSLSKLDPCLCMSDF